MEIVTIAAATGWWALIGTQGKWQRRPLAAWAMVADQGPAWIVGLDALAGETVELLEPARYLHDVTFPVCGCEEPATAHLDRRFCTYCAGLVP